MLFGSRILPVSTSGSAILHSTAESPLGGAGVTMDAPSGATGERVGIGLQEAVEAVRADLLAAQASRKDADIQLPLQKVAIQLQVVATHEAGGQAGFRVPFVNFELGGSASITSGQTSTVTVEFGVPLDRHGNPVKIAQGSDSPKR